MFQRLVRSRAARCACGGGSLALLALATLAPAGLGARQAPLTCGLVKAAVVRSTLGIPVTSIAPVRAAGNPGLTLCWAGTASNPQAVQIAFRSPGAAAFAAARKQAAQYAKSIPGLGSAAFSNSAANPSTNGAVSALKGNVEVSVVAFAPLAKVEQLVRKLLAEV